jgi:hypothetical protein
LSEPDVFREVDEEVQRERMFKLWRAYGKYAVIGVTGLLLAIGGFFGWRDYQNRQAEAHGAQFARALALTREGKNEAAADAFAALAKEAGAGYRALALLQAAAAEARAGDRVAAVALYDQLAADGGAESMWRDLGRVLAVLHLIDSASPAALDIRLKSLTDPNGPWQYTARELAATVRLKAGDTKTARENFRQLADDTGAPAGVRARAAELLAALGDNS